MRGKLLLVSLVLLLTSCRDSYSPKIEICIGDGAGGADCTEADGSHVSKLPSQLKNYWMTNGPDMANFSSWCYQTTQERAKVEMKQIEAGAIK